MTDDLNSLTDQHSDFGIAKLEMVPFEGSLSHAPAPAGGGASLFWLGQAGFMVKLADLTIVIDAYLSDSLAAKYAGTKMPHDRMMPVPVAPEDLEKVDFLLCSHKHTDHCDPETVLKILAASPKSVLVAPRSVWPHLNQIGVPGDRVVLVNAGDHIPLSDSVCLSVTASAHETLDVDENGDHLYLGYTIRSDDLVIFHSGDCVPYEGLAKTVKELGADVALLPINGRRPELSRLGIAGNFSPEEAAELCEVAGIPNLIFHHFGMFAFNSADPEKVQALIDRRYPGITTYPAAVAAEFRITPTKIEWSAL